MRKVRRTTRSRMDVKKILTDLSEKSQPYAEKIAKQINEMVRQLAMLPFRGRSRDEFQPGLRSVVVFPFIIFYQFNDEELLLVRVRHGARDLAAAFSEEDDQ